MSSLCYMLDARSYWMELYWELPASRLTSYVTLTPDKFSVRLCYAGNA